MASKNPQDELDSLKSEIANLSDEYLNLKEQIQRNKTMSDSKLLDMRESLQQVSTPIQTYKGLADIKGRRMPKWYELNIPFEFGDTQPKKASIEISNNPFICTQIQPYYLISDTDPTHFAFTSIFSSFSPFENGSFGSTNAVGRMFPCSAYFALIYRQMFNTLDVSSGDASAYEYIADIFSSYEVDALPKPFLYRGLGWNYPEFDFEIQVQGSGRYWTSNKIPAPAFYGGFNPLYLGYEGFVDTSDRLIVTAHPTTETINTAGIVRFVFFGYEIVTDLTLSDVFGY